MVELMVVIVIVVVLASLAFVAYSRARVASAKTVTISNMRQIHLAVAAWASDHNLGEPMYAANGTASYSHEGVAGPDPVLAPANPAVALYDREDPDEGYLTDHEIFFSPLAQYKIPSRNDYRPDQASDQNLWGTYAWYYPSATFEELTPRQQKAIQFWAPREYSREAKHKLLMAPDYINCEPTWEKFYFALMIDGSVSKVGDSDEEWQRWLYR